MKSLNISKNKVSFLTIILSKNFTTLNDVACISYITTSKQIFLSTKIPFKICRKLENWGQMNYLLCLLYLGCLLESVSQQAL